LNVIIIFYSFVLRFPEDNKLLRGHWAHCLEVDDGIGELRNAFVCDAHFKSDDFIEQNGIMTLNTNAIPSKFKGEVISDYSPIESECVKEPTLTNAESPEICVVPEINKPILPPTSSKSSYTESLSLDETEHQIEKSTNAVDCNSIKYKPQIPRQTKMRPLLPNNKRNDRTSLIKNPLLAKNCKNKSTLPLTSKSTTIKVNSATDCSTNQSVNCTPNQTGILTLEESERKYRFMVSDQMTLRDQQLKNLRSYLKNHTVEKDLFIDMYQHYLEIIKEVLVTEKILQNELIDTSKIKLFNIGTQPLKVPNEIFENFK